MTVPGPFTMSQQAQNDHDPDDESVAMAYADACNEEIRDLFAAGADIVQIDEPYMQARPDAARAYCLAALNRALDGVSGTTAVHICFGYAAIIHERPSGYSAVESSEVVADRVRRALPFVEAERLVLSTDCGMKYLPRNSAEGKMRSMVAAAGRLRNEMR